MGNWISVAVLSLVSGHRLAAPRQEEKIWHDQSARVVKVLTDCLVQLVQLLFAGYASFDDLGPHAPYEVRAHGAARMTGWIDLCLGLDSDIHQASLPEQLGQTAADKQVRAVRLPGTPVNNDVVRNLTIMDEA